MKKKKGKKSAVFIPIMPDACEYCGNTGADRGIDDYGHEHCRLCPEYSSVYSRDSSSRRIERTSPVTGDKWKVWCDGNEVEVKQRNNREAPAALAAPNGVFRRACRMITVVVGTGETAQSFVIEEQLLRFASGYFENGLKNDNFREGATGKFELADEDPEIFGLVNEYLHLGSIKEYGPDGEVDGGFLTITNLPESPTMAEYCRLWLLVDYLQILKLKNYAMWRLLTLTDNSSCCMEIEDVEDIYARAPVDSMLRKFLIHFCVWRDKDEEELELTENAGRDMMRELIKELKRSRMPNGQTSPLMDVRNYYEEESPAPPAPEEGVLKTEPQSEPVAEEILETPAEWPAEEEIQETEPQPEPVAEESRETPAEWPAE